MLPIAALVSLALAWPAAAVPDPSPDAREFRREYRLVYDGLRVRLCGQYIDRGMALTESPFFETETSKNQRYGFLDALDRCARAYARREVVFRSADLKVRVAPGERWPQLVRLGYGAEFGHPESSLDAFEFFLKTDRMFLREMPIYSVWLLMLAADLVDDTGSRKLALLEELERLKYEAPYGNDDQLRFAHARLLLARGRVDEARSRLEGVTALGAIALMRVDALFAPLRSEPAFADRLGFPAAVERDLARRRAALESRPDWMLHVDLYVSALKAARRYDEALAVVDAAIARDDADHRAFSDGHWHRRLLDESRALLLMETGRREEAVEGLLKAANQLEYRRPNVSQMTMLALYLVDLGRADQALRLLPAITGTSRREQAWVEAIRSCAGAQLGREADRVGALDYLKRHERDDPAALSQALICSADMEAAAALMVRRLASQSTSGSALLALQIRPALRSNELPYRQQLLARFDDVRRHADVRSALMTVGTIEQLPLDLDVTF